MSWEEEAGGWWAVDWYVLESRLGGVGTGYVSSGAHASHSGGAQDSNRVGLHISYRIPTGPSSILLYTSDPDGSP